MEAFKDLGVKEFLAYYSDDEALTGFFTKLGFHCSESDRVVEIPVVGGIKNCHQKN